MPFAFGPPIVKGDWKGREGAKRRGRCLDGHKEAGLGRRGERQGLGRHAAELGRKQFSGVSRERTTRHNLHTTTIIHPSSLTWRQCERGATCTVAPKRPWIASSSSQRKYLSANACHAPTSTPDGMIPLPLLQPPKLPSLMGLALNAISP